MRAANHLPATLLLTALTALGCGETTTGPATPNPADSAASVDSGGSGGGSGGGDATTLPAAKVSKEEFDLSIGPVLDVTTKAKGVVIRPDSCTASAKCPLVVVVGDHGASPYPAYLEGASQMAGALQVGVILFNLPGRGEAQYLSGSKKDDDIGGPLHYTAVRDVLKLKGKGDWMDTGRVGYVTIGTGLTPVAKALKTFGSVAPMNQVKFLIDVEGPVDRCDYSQAAADETLGIGPEAGPGVSEGACHVSSGAPLSAMYPPGKDGKPDSIVCSENAYPISKTGKNCTEGTWWSDREAFNYLKETNLRYQRLQFKYDHAMPGYWASRKAVQAVVSSKSPYFQINNMEACGPAFSDEDCAGLPCWLEGPWGNGIAPAPFAGADFKAITPTDLFTQVLPGYVARMLDDKVQCP
jgi:hypothetical protein